MSEQVWDQATQSWRPNTGGGLSAAAANGAHINPVDGTQNTNHTNSQAPANASLSNTAAGYTTLGGKYAFAAVAGAATDYALFAYQVPVGKRLIVQGCGISAINTGAAVATTAHVLDWSIATGSTAVSLATAGAAGPKRHPLGVQGMPVSSPIGFVAADLYRHFPSPLIVEGGRFLHVILTMPVATNTGSQVIRGAVMISGYFEK